MAECYGNSGTIGTCTGVGKIINYLFDDFHSWVVTFVLTLADHLLILNMMIYVYYDDVRPTPTIKVSSMEMRNTGWLVQPIVSSSKTT